MVRMVRMASLSASSAWKNTFTPEGTRKQAEPSGDRHRAQHELAGVLAHHADGGIALRRVRLGRHG